MPIQLPHRRPFFAALALAFLAGCAGMGGGPAGVIAPGAQWEEVSRAGLATSEGVVADRDGRVYASDITRAAIVKQNTPGGTIWRYDPGSGAVSKFLEPSGQANGLHFDRNGDLLIAQANDVGGGRAIVRRNMRTGAMTVLADSYEGKRFLSPNDITSDAAGRIYFTDARYSGPEPMELPNAVYRIDPDGRIVRLATDILRPNGIEVSPDGRRLYVSATNNPALAKNPNGPFQDRFGIINGGVAVYDLDASGNISNGRIFYRDDEIMADSMAMDTDGNLYVAMHNGNPANPKGYLVVLDPNGKEIARPPMPERSLPTNVGFGRGSDSGSLYVTNLAQWRLFRTKTVRRGLYWD
jgi:gluconolactonase